MKVVALSSCGAIRRAEVDCSGGYEAVVVASLLQHETQNERGVPQLLEHRSTHQEVVGMNPAECWDFCLDLPF